MTRVAHISDVEGSWARLSSFFARTDGLRLDADGRLHVDDDDLVFVFGGDAIDRGPWSRRVVRALLDVKLRQPARVVLLAGNRDLNKLRLPRELAGALPKKAPPEVHALWASRRPGSRAEVLRWIFTHTMGAQPAFDMRRAELVAEGVDAADDAVVDSFLDELRPPDGAHVRYLQQCQLAWRCGRTLFLHGGFADESLGHVPGQPALDDLDAWIAALNGFCADQLARYVARPVVVDGEPDWLPLVLYQAPVKGLGRNPHSVVYGRFGSDPWNNPRLPSSSSLRWLADRGVARVVVGHTPCGDLPSFLRSREGVEIVIADNSRGRVDVGLSVVVTDAAVRVRACTKLDDGTLLDVDYVHERDDVIDHDDPVGRLTADGRLVKAVLPDDRALLFRCDDGFAVRQTIVARRDLGPLAAPLDVPLPPSSPSSPPPSSLPPSSSPV
jgi:hypothetical protein